jgi:predicted Rossmann fold flavoprotein
VSADLPIAVLGAGAAGLMASLHAVRAGARVVLLEGTPDGGRKILISGGGRCNVLPSVLEPGRFVSSAPPHLVRRLLAAWPLREQRAFFEQDLGIPLALEDESGKLFPVSNRARDVRDCLVNRVRAAGVECRFGHRVTEVRPAGGHWSIHTVADQALAARAVIVTTGGLSVPATGSDGFGLALARELGHSVEPTYPALTPLLADPPVHAGLAGLSLGVTLEARSARQLARATGGFLFTHRGYSGPAVLDVSHVAVRSKGSSHPATIRVQWAGLDRAAWEESLTRRSALQVVSALREHLPARLAERLLLESAVAPETQLAQLPREARHGLLERLVRYQLPWTGDEGYKKAEVTGGGVALGEVDPASLESQRAAGLFFAGEVLDAFGPIGGYNFAWAWATGRTAGLGAGRR